MSTSKPRPARPHASDPPSTAAPPADLARRQLAVGAHAAGVVLQGFEAMRHVQQQAAHDARRACEALAGKLQEPCTVQDLLAAHADLMRQELHGAALYWQQLGAIGLETQRQLLAIRAPQLQGDGDAGSGLAVTMPFFDASHGPAAAPHH